MTGRKLEQVSSLVLTAAGLCLIVWSHTAYPASTEEFPTNDPNLVVETIAEGVPFPTNLTFSPDGRLFFLEKNSGNVRVFDTDWNLQEDPVIRIQPVAPSYEAGLIGMAFSPNYGPEGGMVYVSHTSAPDTWRISSFFEDGSGHGNDLQIVMDFPDCVTEGSFVDIHNIENIHFGPNPVSASPDQVLYISFGDGGIPFEDPPVEDHPSQDPSRWCGGLFFIDPVHPPSLIEAASHNFCLGLRNAFDFCFHPLSGVIYLTDNSFDRNDEVNQIHFGGNYGWPLYTGAPGAEGYEDAFVTFPVSTAPTGICVYSGSRLPKKYRNQVLFCDFLPGSLQMLTLTDPGDPNTEWFAREYILGGPEASDSRPLGVGLVDITPGPDGWIYFCGGSSNSFGTGNIYRLRTVEGYTPISMSSIALH